MLENIRRISALILRFLKCEKLVDACSALKKSFFAQALDSFQHFCLYVLCIEDDAGWSDKVV